MQTSEKFALSASRTSKIDVVIIGAGISGLVTAYELQKLGYTVAIFEASNRVGGVLDSVEVEGFHLELGANSFLLKKKAAELIKELQIKPVEASAASKTRYLYLKDGDRGHFHKVPSSLTEFITSKILSANGKFRLIKGALTKPLKAVGDESVFEFASKRFGNEFAERVVAPGLSGIYAANISTLSARTSLPYLWNLCVESEQKINQKSIFRSFLARKRKSTFKSRMIQFERGMRTPAEVLAQKLEGKISLLAPAKKLQHGLVVELADGFFMEAKAVVIATESKSAAELLSAVDSKLAEEIANIFYSPLGLLYVSGRPDDLKAELGGVGFLKQPLKGESLLGVLYSSTSFPTVTRENKVLLTCFVGGSTNPELSDVTNDSLKQKAFSEIKKIMGLGESFKILHAHFWSDAIPSYPIGHYQLAAKVVGLEKENIFVAANWLGKPGLSECVERAMDIAAVISAQITAEVTAKIRSQNQ